METKRIRRRIQICCTILWLGLWVLTQRDFGVKISQPSFVVSWVDDKTTYLAGDVATIKIKPLDNPFNNDNTYKMHFSVSVRGKKGNSSYISAVFPFIDGDPAFWNISFTPIQVGEFSAVVFEDYSGVADSSLHFNVSAGHMYPSACLPSWMDLAEEFVAGTKAYLLIFPKDAFGNNISSVNEPTKDYFTLSSSYQNGSSAENFNFLSSDWNELGYFGIEFIPTISGRLLLHVHGDSQTLNGSPLAFMVKPGLLNITNSMAKWKYEISSLQIFSKAHIFIHQKDQFGNLVSGFYPFDAQVVQKATGLSVPVADLSFQVVAFGVQLLSFHVSEPGDFMLTIFNAKLNESVSNVPYPYTVFVGYCHGLNSFANGSGLIRSVAGIMSYFTVFLEDIYHNPSPVEAENLYVEIFSRNGSFMVRPIIFPLKSLNGTFHGAAAGQRDTSGYVPSMTSKGNSPASEFRVTYIPEKSGDYVIRLFCGNIPLNDGSPYFMNVSPGVVDTFNSKVVNFKSKVQRLEKNAVSVQLVDSYWNSVPSQEANLNLQLQDANSSSFMKIAFVENKDGLYIGFYSPRDQGTCNICISFMDKFLSPCPIEIHVHERKYFPEANNDTVSVWEDESVIFDVLSNDYASDGRVSIAEFTKPLHGSLLQCRELFRYTPYKGYFGVDSFSYIISDINNNIAAATCFISVLCKPPQFISFPLILNVTEDILSPQFGGFPGFKMMYSNKKENISLTISAKSGSVYLAPSHIEISEPVGGMLSIRRGGRAEKDLILAGQIEVINSALQLIQYLSNENFYGDDIISLYSTNKNGVQDSHVPVYVKPINDPPVIHAPKFIILGRNEANDTFQIYDKQRDVFELSITDTDIFYYSGNRSHLTVMFSVEVTDGLLSTTLPVHLIKTTELKIKSSNQWQPLQTFVIIADQFIMKGKGIRFQGTIGDCNSALQRLFYQGANLDAMLTITVNDLGNYGCCLDCTDMKSFPLSTEASVNIIKRRPLNSTTAFLLGSAIIFEIAMLFILGGLLLFFICKCMNALHIERTNSHGSRSKPTVKLFNNQREKTSVAPLNDAMNTRGISSPASLTRKQPISIPLSLSRKHSNFRQRSHRGIRSEGSQKFELPVSYECLGDGVQLSPSYIEMQQQWQKD